MAQKDHAGPGRWLRIDFAVVPEGLTDALANFLEESGAEGTSQEALAEPGDAVSPESSETPHYTNLTAYLSPEKKEALLAALDRYLEDLHGIFPDLEKTTYRIEEITADWAEEWKKYFHPFRVGKQFIIKPTWEPYHPEDGDIVIEIDPGMAFGTGQHPSTMMCIEAMETIFSEHNPAGWSVLDVGTGTGILAIAAVKLGVRQTLGIDIDGQATAVSCNNAVLNRVGHKMTVRNREISSLRRRHNLIVANLTAKLLVALADDFSRLLAPGGYLVISGIIEANREAIEAAFPRSGLTFRRLLKQQEWLCYIFQRH